MGGTLELRGDRADNINVDVWGRFGEFHSAQKKKKKKKKKGGVWWHEWVAPHRSWIP